MSDNQNDALRRTTQAKPARRYWSPPMLDTPAGALEAARNGWWGGGWLALSSVIDGGIGIATYANEPSALTLVLAIDGVLLLVGAGLAWQIYSRHPLWAIIVLLALLSLNLLVALLTLHLGFGLIINAVLIYNSINAIRGCRRLAAFQRGRMTPAQAGKVFE
jgi:hypothetical protein